MESSSRPVIAGIDPGSRVAGYAFLRAKMHEPVLPSDWEILDAGVMKVDAKLNHTDRISLLHDAVFELASEHGPSIFVLERAFADRNIASALRLGEVRGAFMAAAGRVRAEVRELTPAHVKKMITGNGRADKEDVSRAIQSLLGYDRGSLPHDVTDALAIALSYGMAMRNEKRQGAST